MMYNSDNNKVLLAELRAPLRSALAKKYTYIDIKIIHVFSFIFFTKNIFIQK